MFIFFGSRSSKISEKKMQGHTACPYCEIQNTFTVTTFGTYFHVFWIPLFPLSKNIILECNHCKKSYNQNEIPVEINKVVLEENPKKKVKRPLWHGCGCLIIIALFLLLLVSITIGYFSNKNMTDAIDKDPRKGFLKSDLNKVSATPAMETDSISFYLKPCVSSLIEGIKTNDIKYYSKIENNKLLILLKVTDMKKIEKSSRKELVFAVEDCLLDLNLVKTHDCYIGIDGKWNMLLVKTPDTSDLSGKYVNKSLLLPFYDKDSIPAIN